MNPVTTDWFDLRVGHVLDKLRELPDEHVHAVLTSPPYYGLRSYATEPVIFGGDRLHEHEWGKPWYKAGQTGGVGSSTLGAESGGNAISPEHKVISQERQQASASQSWSCPCGAWKGQLGLEPQPSQYIDHLCEVFREVWRVLRSDGSAFVNLGDTYGPDKNLLGIPWRFAFAMRESGWILRSENIWHKLGAMPESVFDRPGREHEHVFQFTKQARYFYDPDAVRVKYSGPVNRWGGAKVTAEEQKDSPRGLDRDRDLRPNEDGRLLRSVWSMPTANYPGAHFAVWPGELAAQIIKCSTSQKGCCEKCGAPIRRVVEAQGETVEERRGRGAGRKDSMSPRADGGVLQHSAAVVPPEGRPRKLLGWEPSCSHSGADVVPCTVLDPFAGSGTTMVQARRLDRRSVGVELSESYARGELLPRLEMWWRDRVVVREEPVAGQLTLE